MRQRIWREEDSWGGTVANCYKKHRHIGFGGGKEIEKERFSKRKIFSAHIDKERESSSRSSGLVKENRSSLVFGEAEKDFQVWSSWLPVHFSSTVRICVLMLKIIFYSCYGLSIDYLWHGLRTLSLPHHSIPFFNVFGCRLLGYWWLWMLIIHLLLIWFSMRWSDFILTALCLGNHTFV